MLGGLYEFDGWLCVDEYSAIAGGAHGIPYCASGAIAVTNEGTPSTSGNGFAFDSAGRLCVTSANAIAGGYAGLPFDSSGRLCVAKGGTVAYTGVGVAADSNGRVLANLNALREREWALASDSVALRVA